MSALARELEEARKRAGDAEAEAYALRRELAAFAAVLPQPSEPQPHIVWKHAAEHPRGAEAVTWAVESAGYAMRREIAAQPPEKRNRLTVTMLFGEDKWNLTLSRGDYEHAMEQQRDEARDVIAATCAALGESATGDLARDVAGLVATLREHEIALARATEGVRERDDLIRIVAKRLGCTSEWHDITESLPRSPEPAPQPERLQLCTPEAPEPPNAVGDVWRVGESERVAHTVDESSVDPLIGFDFGFCARVSRLHASGYRRIRCAPEAPKAALAVGDPVHVRLDDRAAVGRIGRSPTDGTLEAWRVEADDGREFYGREGDIERVAVEGAK